VSILDEFLDGGYEDDDLALLKHQIEDPRVVTSSGGGMCPNQHWGKLTDGSVFYFRMRHGWSSLRVGPPGTKEEDLPLVNPAWDQGAANAAYDAQREYPHSFWLGPIGEDTPYPGDDLIGFFRTKEDLNESFRKCLDQIWKENGIDYTKR